MINKISDSIVYIGCNDHDIDLFEGHFDVPLGMAYNSYAVIDEKIAIFDTMDKSKTSEWLDNIKEAIGDKTPDYLIIQHMEPDHSASIKAFVENYPETVIVSNSKSFKMISQFFRGLELANTLEVNDGDTLSIGSHEFTFVMAPMVHWPEVMMTYEASEKVLFSADGFGKFGALDVEDPEGWACEARRYYFGIVGKYGAQVQKVLQKAANLDIQTICPLHGPVLDEDLEYYLNTYNTWSSYEAEDKGVAIFYTSVYGNTKAAVELLAEEIEALGEEIVDVIDLAREDMYECVEDAFRYDRIVLATTTYNGGIFPYMREFLGHLEERNYQNRTIGMIENGSWGPNAIRTMKKEIEGFKNITLTENNVTILSSMTEENKTELKALAEELVNGTAAVVEEEAAASKKWVCKICGCEVEADELPDDYQCPICKVGKQHFEEA